MSSKDLDDICSSDEWGESMDVAESENTSGLNSEANVNTPLNVPAAQVGILPPTSPSVEMSESNEVKPQKSPIEMDPDSPSDRINVPEIEMLNEPNTNDDAEMKDLTVKSPEDVGELKSPSPTIEMIDDNPISESLKSPIPVPAVEMNESLEDNIESEILSSPPPSKEVETDLASKDDNFEELPAEVSEEEHVLKSPGETEDDFHSTTDDLAIGEQESENLTDKPTEEIDNADKKLEEELDKDENGTEDVNTSLENDISELSDGAEEETTEAEKDKESITKTAVTKATTEENITTEETSTEGEKTDDVKETEILDKDTSEKETESSKLDEPKPSTSKDDTSTEKPYDDKEISEERCLSAAKSSGDDDNTQMSDGIGDQDSVTNFDDESQMSGDASKDATELSNKLDNVEGVTVPGGADGDVNVEEELGDDPLGATLDDKDNDDPMEEEILGDTSSNEVSILPDSTKTLPAGSAEGDEILPLSESDKSKKVDEILPLSESDKSKEVDEILPLSESDKSKKSDDCTTEKSDAKDDAENSSEDKTEGDATVTEKEEGEKKEGEEAASATTATSEETPKDPDDPDKPVTEEGSEKTDESKKESAPEIEVMEIDDDDDDDFKSDQVSPLEEYCHQCKTRKTCQYKVKSEFVSDVELFLCDKECRQRYEEKRTGKKKAASPAPEEAPEASVAPFDPEEALKRRCSQCKLEVSGNREENLSWETMDFCNENCLGAYQKELGSFCANCKGSVMSSSMGKYCVRFGFNVRQFCTSSCLEEFKKGLKVCSYCQRDISGDVEGFLAPIGEKGQFKDFCTQACMQSYEEMSSGRPRPTVQAKCAVCCDEKDVAAQVLQLGGGEQKLCSNPCLAAFKFANNLHTELCEMCKKYFDLRLPERQTIFHNDVRHHFCSKTCLNVNTLASRKIVACNWCKVKKYNFDMIRKVVSSQQQQQGPQAVMLCSLNCLALYQVSLSATSSKLINCDNCQSRAQGMYHLTMSDATVRNFCNYQCCIAFQQQFTGTPILAQTPTPTGGPMRYVPPEQAPPKASSSSAGGQIPVITSVTSLAPAPPPPPVVEAPPPPAQVKIVQQVFIKPPAVKQGVNKMTQCKPNTSTKGVSCKPITSSKHTQTEEEAPTKVLIPIPVPIYIPAPMHMFSQPFPVPVPFPLPIPVPIFIPTTRNTAKGIRKEIKRIQEQIPRDPFEAELLMMAEMVAEDKRGEVTSSDSEDDNGGDQMGESAPSPPQDDNMAADSPANSVGNDEVEFSPDGVDPTPSFGEDMMLQMALKMASELTEPSTAPTMDLETALAPAQVSAPPQPPPQMHHTVSEEEEVKVPEVRQTRKRARGRSSGADWAPPVVTQSSKRARTNSQDAASAGGASANQQAARTSNGSPTGDAPDPAIEPDPNLSLKYTYGVLAFRKWIRQKNAELHAKSGRAAKLFKTDILQLSTDELNFALCMFVREVRKPDGDEYAPDIIYYLCLGIQLYLYRSQRIDNIFTDAYYEKFTESLNEISLRFTARLADRTLVTRVEEEHLWESQQLGAHSPHVLLFTLMFFNTKHFLLTEVEDHMRLSFTHVMKHWKRNHAQPGKTGSTRNVLLRYYPPQSVLDADDRKKKVYEQQENEQNPLRCPVKLYEFYVSKCPESVRGRNDVFYLLPERSCVPDSPVWYSTMALPRDAISRMLNRTRMVREVLTLLQSLNY